jgi:hypothetical protein
MACKIFMKNHVFVCVCVCVFLGGNVCDEDLDLDFTQLGCVNTQAQQVINKTDFYTILQICNSTCYECYMTM